MLNTVKMSIAAMLAAGALHAVAAEKTQTSPPSAPAGVTSDLNLFIQLDANKDGVVTRAEAEKSATVKGDFDAMDRDRNGAISREEWVEHYSKGKAGTR